MAKFDYELMIPAQKLKISVEVKNQAEGTAALSTNLNKLNELGVVVGSVNLTTPATKGNLQL